MDEEYIDTIEEVTGEDYLNEDERHIWDRKKSSPMPIILLGVGFVVMILLFIIFLTKTTDMASKKEIVTLEKRVAHLEERLVKLADIDKELTLFDTQRKKFDLLLDRFDRFETSTSLKLDIINNELYTSPNRGRKTAKSKKPEPAKVSQKMAHPVYHEVKAKETLYQISRRYGITVDDLRKLNRLTPEAVIHPGQKLIVAPVESQ
ncbi:MAG: LysM domain-containing protein [Thermodesulfobacteriota bacterium]|nr:LysM domain-containing protein [Thermodesulfobacteriota bacterium]